MTVYISTDGGRTRGAGGALGLWFLFVMVFLARMGGATSSQTFAAAPVLVRCPTVPAVGNAHQGRADSMRHFADATGLNQYHLVAPGITIPCECYYNVG